MLLEARSLRSESQNDQVLMSARLADGYLLMASSYLVEMWELGGQGSSLFVFLKEH